jgi:hypothetical protein
MARFSFNSNDAPVATAPTRGPLPPGRYECIITKSDIKETKAGTGQYIELEMQVVAGEHSGRRIWERLNVSNPNKQAEDIAKAALGALCVAVNVVDMEDTEQLHDIPFVASVEIDRKDPERNRIVGYGSTGAAPAAKPAAPLVKPAAPAGARPWQR